MRPKDSYVDGYRNKRAIWAFVSEHPDSSLAEIAAGVGLSKSGARYHVDTLLSTGVLVAPRGATGARRIGVLRVSVPLITISKDGKQ